MKKQRGYGDVIVFITMVLIIVGILGISYGLKGIQCNKRAKLMGLQSDYGMWTGCMVKVEDRYAPINYIRIVDNKIIIQGDGE
jgi:hypothetical protein